MSRPSQVSVPPVEDTPTASEPISHRPLFGIENDATTRPPSTAADEVAPRLGNGCHDRSGEFLPPATLPAGSRPTASEIISAALNL